MSANILTSDEEIRELDYHRRHEIAENAEELLQNPGTLYEILDDADEPDELAAGLLEGLLNLEKLADQHMVRISQQNIR